MSITNTLIELQARLLQRLTHGAEREVELAAELGPLNEAVHDSAFDLEDVDEPGAFPRVLIEGARKDGEETS